VFLDKGRTIDNVHRNMIIVKITRLYTVLINDLGDTKCIFERVTDTNMKQLENSMETHRVYLEMTDMCSISYSTNVNAIFEFSPCTPQLIDVG
jgi:hypothetical protein